MKRIIAYLVPLLALAASCGAEKQDGSYDTTQLVVESADIASFPPSGGTGTIVIATPGTLTASSDQTWCRTPVSGSTVTVTVDTTTSITERTALVTVAVGERRVYFPVTQAAILLTLSAEAIEFPATGGSEVISVAVSTRATVTSDQAWCRAILTGDEISITVDTTTAITARAALVTIASGEKTRDIAVTQRAPLAIGAYPAYISAASGVIRIDYECDSPITCTPSDWITATIEEGTIILEMTANPFLGDEREGTVTVTGGPFSATINLVQAPGITVAVPDPAVDAVSAFMNLKNYNGTSSRYRASGFSTGLQVLWDNLAAFSGTLSPALSLQNLRVEAPRSSYKYSFILHWLEGATNRYYYWNSANGFTTPTGGNALFNVLANVSGNSYSSGMTQSGSLANSPDYVQFRAFFTASTGLTIIQEDATTFYFRGIADPTRWIKFEATSW